MPPRSTWKGFVNLSLVSVAVKAFTASSEGSQIRLNQLHADCNSRIRLQKTCPQHGDITNDEVVMGYEYAKDQYVRIDLSELDQLRSADGLKSITVATFISPESISDLHFTDAVYFLTPDGAAGQKPYRLIHRAMKEMNVYCVAQAVLHKREQLVLIRPVDDLLVMTVLKYSEQLKSPSSFDDELTDVNISDEELNLAKTLIRETYSEEFDLAEFKDEYTAKLTQLIEAKVSGQEIVASPPSEPRNVINLMDALKASVSQAKQSSKSSKPKKAAKKQAAKADPTTGALKASLEGKARRKTKKKSKKTG